MKKILVCVKQKSEGCDYTIACGKSYYITEGLSKEKVIEEIIYPNGRDETLYGDEFDSALEGEHALSEIIVVPLDGVEVTTVDCEGFLDVIKGIREEQKSKTNKEEELELLKKLKEKYPDH